eukprot:TRINITY_DN48934_c0_g1_i1.p1 TRINITY_DN48934_c0_g1~~TRINITY_DN48934_c0_g1_i1.p1  ORF type:complete len:214 (-),score=19.61 TRINITY_DN48934_c0_g1_i1:566-1207(-)
MTTPAQQPSTQPTPTQVVQRDANLAQIKQQWVESMRIMSITVPRDPLLVIRLDPTDATILAHYPNHTHGRDSLRGDIHAALLQQQGNAGQIAPIIHGLPIDIVFPGCTFQDLMVGAAAAHPGVDALRTRLQAVFAAPGTTTSLRWSRVDLMEELLAWSSANGANPAAGVAGQTPDNFTYHTRPLFAAAQAFAMAPQQQAWEDDLGAWIATNPY